MVNRGLPFSPGPDDFALERGDTIVQLLDRKRIKILRDHRSERIARLARENLVVVHVEDR